MNTDALAKLYDRLTPFERLPLIMAAVERGDDAEADRLSRSAPRMHVRLPDYHGLGEGLLLLSLFHALGLLHLGLLQQRLTALAVEFEEFPVDPADKARASRLRDLARTAAYLFCVEADGWRLLCAELKIDPEALLKDLPYFEMLRISEESARASGWGAEETAAFLRRCGRGEVEPRTAEDAAKAMRAFLDQRVRWWG
jgi:hypothetical protein